MIGKIERDLRRLLPLLAVTGLGFTALGCGQEQPTDAELGIQDLSSHTITSKEVKSMAQRLAASALRDEHAKTKRNKEVPGGFIIESSARSYQTDREDDSPYRTTDKIIVGLKNPHYSLKEMRSRKFTNGYRKLPPTKNVYFAWAIESTGDIGVPTSQDEIVRSVEFSSSTTGKWDIMNHANPIEDARNDNPSPPRHNVNPDWSVVGNDNYQALYVADGIALFATTH